jgi:threonyl-tRNA synthetase
MTLNDAHAFCTPEQVTSEISGALAMIEAAYTDLGLGSHRYRLSCRGEGDKYVADDDLWARATAVLREVLADSGVEYFEADDEAAFYGPKIDVQLAGAHGREETVSTIQVDLLLPERFDLAYLDPNDERQRPVIVHRSVISTLERMVAHLVDRHGPALPPWLAPRQVVVLPVGAAYDADADALAARLRAAFLRVEIDRDGTLGARIAAHRASVPWLAVVGEREAAGNTVAVRARDGRQFAVDQGAFVGAASNIVAAHGHDLGV